MPSSFVAPSLFWRHIAFPFHSTSTFSNSHSSCRPFLRFACTAPDLLFLKDGVSSFVCCFLAFFAHLPPVAANGLQHAPLQHLSQTPQFQRHFSPADTCRLQRAFGSLPQTAGSQLSGNRRWPSACGIQSLVPTVWTGSTTIRTHAAERVQDSRKTHQSHPKPKPRGV